MRKCKVCGEKYTPTRPMQTVCGDIKCAIEQSRRIQAKKIKLAQANQRAETRKKLEAMDTLPSLLKKAQAVFNRFIRLRDKDKLCICCGMPLGVFASGGDYDAGHYRSVGAAGHLRFNEDNVHAQRKYCNNHLAGNIQGYRKGLIERIGIERVEALENNNVSHKWDKDEVREIIATYKQKCKELEK